MFWLLIPYWPFQTFYAWCWKMAKHNFNVTNAVKNARILKYVCNSLIFCMNGFRSMIHFIPLKTSEFFCFYFFRRNKKRTLDWYMLTIPIWGKQSPHFSSIFFKRLTDNTFLFSASFFWEYIVLFHPEKIWTFVAKPVKDTNEKQNGNFFDFRTSCQICFEPSLIHPCKTKLSH